MNQKYAFCFYTFLIQNFFYIFSEEFTPTFTAAELGVELKLDSDVVIFLENEPFDEQDPLIILEFMDNFPGPSETKKNAVYNALINAGAQQIKGNVFKFIDWDTLHEARRLLKNVIPWAFFSYWANCINTVRLPTIQTTVVTWFSEKKLTTIPFQFFEV